MKWRVLAAFFCVLCAGGVPPGLGKPEFLITCAMSQDLSPGQASDSVGSSGGFGSAAMTEASAPPPSGSAQAVSIGLAWDPSPEPSVVGYRIHYGVESGKYTNMLRVKGRLTTKALVKNLEKGKTYYFAITAYDARGHESALSAEVTNSSDGGRPAAPPATNRLNPNGSGNPAGTQIPPGQIGEAGKIPPKSYPKTSEGKIAPSR